MDERIIDQDGVIGRKQLIAAGWAPHDIRRALRRRDLAPLRPGVYVNHTGSPNWVQHAWGALLAVSTAVDLDDVALSHESALRAYEGPGRRVRPDFPVHVMVDARRRLGSHSGVVVHRSRHFEARRYGGRPPRVRYEEALLDVAAASGDMDALAALTNAVGSRLTTAPRILAAAQSRAWLGRRHWFEDVLTDIAQGTHSVLERGFVTRVTRAHGLPDPRRQVREETAIGVAYRDARYGGVIIELDGRGFHSSFERHDADLERDLVAAVSRARTIRLGWGQVFNRPCRTAVALGSIAALPVRGCSPTCPAERKCGDPDLPHGSGSPRSDDR